MLTWTITSTLFLGCRPRGPDGYVTSIETGSGWMLSPGLRLLWAKSPAQDYGPLREEKYVHDTKNKRTQQRHPAAAPATSTQAPKRTQQQRPAAVPPPNLPSAHGSGKTAAVAAPKPPSAHGSTQAPLTSEKLSFRQGKARQFPK